MQAIEIKQESIAAPEAGPVLFGQWRPLEALPAVGRVLVKFRRASDGAVTWDVGWIVKGRLDGPWKYADEAFGTALAWMPGPDVRESEWPAARLAA